MIHLIYVEKRANLTNIYTFLTGSDTVIEVIRCKDLYLFTLNKNSYIKIIECKILTQFDLQLLSMRISQVSLKLNSLFN